MNLSRRCAFASAAILAAMHVSAADDPAARAALEQAHSRQEALPGYVEHLFGRAPDMPTDDGSLSGRLVERATSAVRERVSEATSQLPVGATLADSALARLGEQADDLLTITFGPEREFAMIQHAGDKHRETFAAGAGELVRANGRMALMLDLGPQIARMKRMLAMDVTEDTINEVRTVRETLRGISLSLIETGVAGLFGAVVGIFDEVQSLLVTIRRNAEIARAIGMLEQMSGHWQCTPDDLFLEEPTDLGDVQQLADETIDGVPAHVYEQTRDFALEADDEEYVDEDEAEDGFGDALLADFKVRTVTWVSVAAGLPLRTVYELPDGHRQRTDYEYPPNVDFELPECVKAP